MAVREILDDQVIDLNMNAKNKDEVIRHLTELLKNAGYIEDLGECARDVYVKESERITGIGGHVATLHGKPGHMDHMGIAVGRTRDMIDWESYGGEPSRLFFLLVVPAHSDGAKNRLHLIAELAGKLGSGNTVRRPQTAAFYDDLLEALSQRR